MSREQWGHGYWQGVNDALSGNIVKNDIEKLSRVMICCMCKINKNNTHDRLLFPVSSAFRFFCDWIGIDEKDFKTSYTYILNNEPLGCYVSGYPNDDMMNDYFVLPNLTDKYIEEVLSHDNL